MEPEVMWFGRGNRGPGVKKGSWAHTTGSHVFWNEKPLASVKKGSWAQGEVKPLEKTRAQSPKSNFWNGGDPYMIHIWF